MNLLIVLGCFFSLASCLIGFAEGNLSAGLGWLSAFLLGAALVLARSGS